MRKVGLILMSVLVIAGCAKRHDFEPVPNCRGDYTAPRPVQTAQQQPVYGQQPYYDECYSSDPCQGFVPQEAVYVDQGYIPQPHEQVISRRNIKIREKTSYSVTYEFQEVRLDEVVRYADEYCSYLNSKALLRESLTHKNNSRLATFDCVK